MSLNPFEIPTVSELSHQNTSTNFSFIDILELEDMLSPEMRTIIENHSSTPILLQVLEIMFKKDMLTQANLSLVVNRRNPFNIYFALQNLKDHDLLDNDNIRLIATRENALDLIHPIIILRKANIENIDIITSVLQQNIFAKILTSLSKANLLDQTNFDSLMQANHLFLLSEEAYKHVWAKLPSELLNQANFLRLLKAAECASPMAPLQRVRDIILNLQTQPKPHSTSQLSVSAPSVLPSSLFKRMFAKQEEHMPTATVRV